MSGLENPTSIQTSRDFYLSPMTEHDLLEVVEIEEASGLSRWGWEAYHAELAEESRSLMFVTRVRAGESGLFHGKRIKGFIAARLIADEVHVNNVAVREEERRQRIGEALLLCVIEEGRRLGARLAFLEVRASNRVAQALYEKCGFRHQGVRRNYYSDPVEDALVMSRTI
jgi:ribosomal-protein-alanine N-acetyltransferase